MGRKAGICLVVFSLLFAPVFGGAAGERVLCLGMSGADVHSLQKLLLDLGHDLAVDGIFGAQTLAAVQEIQKAAGLAVDGLVGPQTISFLRELHQSLVAYTVQTGDNLSILARRYNTTVGVIASYNALANPDRLLAGQVIYIPTASLTAMGKGVTARPSFIWPLRGRLSSGYGFRLHPITKTRHFHGGIDIAVSEGTPVRAAAAGKVLQAGAMGNYGLGVVLDHGNGYTTWYGHNSKVLVRVGESVRQGQTIAQSGRSGLATGPHLDFRIKIGDQTVDPLQWLPNK